MIDFVPVVDVLGEPLTVAGIAFALALSFGFLAERSGFCTRSAINNLLDRRFGPDVAVWLTAFGSAILFAQAALFSGVFSAEESRFFSGAQSLSGPVVGGALFGVGMALARGCSSRLLVLGATGNLRAISAILVMAVSAYATLSGFLVPFRDTIAGGLNTSILVSNDITSLTGGGTATGIVIGLAIIVTALLLAVRAGHQPVKIFMGLAIGIIFATDWIATHSLSGQLFDPIAIESLSFVRPASTLAELPLSGSEAALFTMDSGLLAGIVVGAFISAIAFGSFRVQRFSDEGAPHFLRYLVGGSLMGFGGVLAGGCTVGAGFSGGSILAISALLALFSMMAASALTEIVLRRLEDAGPAMVAVPAE